MQKEIEITNYRRYYQIAKEAMTEALECATNRDKEISDQSENYGKIVKLSEKVHKESIICIVFSALALEAFINEYGRKRIKSYLFKNHLEKIELRAKILLYPILANHPSLKINSQHYKNIDWLIKLRNKLVHYKSKTRKISEMDYRDPLKQTDFMLESHADMAFKTLEGILNRFEK